MVKLVVDTREQTPWWIKDVVVDTLNVGDYSIENHTDKFAIERKSMADLVQTLTKGHARFKRELQRAESFDAFFIVVEQSYETLLRQEWTGARYTRMKGYQIAAIVDTLRVKYKIQILFCESRVTAKTLARNLAKAYLRTFGGKGEELE